MPKRNRTRGPVKLRIPLRTFVILSLALAAGVVTTVLLWATAVPFFQAILSGIAASAGTYRFLDKIMKQDPSRC